MEEERLIAGEMQSEDMEIETSLRPRSLREYFGQQKVKDSLSIYISAALRRHSCRCGRGRTARLRSQYESKPVKRLVPHQRRFFGAIALNVGRIRP